MVGEIAAGEEVHINVAGAAMEQLARAVLAGNAVPLVNIFFHHNPTNDAWCRDHGPIFVERTVDGRRERADSRLGLQRVGRQVSAVRSRRRDPDAGGRGNSAFRSSRRG